MNQYRWEDLSLGLAHGFDATFTEEMAADFARISGDTNPLHTDGTYAAGAGFPSPVLFGMLTSSLYSRLAGVYLPGKYALLHGMDLDFSLPCFPGDVLRCEGKIVYLNEAYRRFEIKASIRNQKGERVSRALIRVGFHV